MKRPVLGAIVIAFTVGTCLTGCAPKSEIGAAPPVSDRGPASDSTSSPGSGSTGSTPDSPASPSNGQPNAPAVAGQPETANSGQGTVLKFVFEKGSEYKFQEVLESTQEMSSNGKSASPPTLKTLATVTVKALESNKLQYSVSGVKISGPESDQAVAGFAKAAKEMDGLTLTASVDGTGTASDVRYIKGTKEQALFAGIDTSDGFFGVKYPSNSVNIGDTWSHTFDFKDIVSMAQVPGGTWKDDIVASRFTLKSIDASAGTALIELKVEASPTLKLVVPQGAGGKAGAGAEGKEVTFNFSIKSSGTMTVDLKTGMQRQMDFTQVVTSKDTMSGRSGTQTAKVSLKRG